MTTWLTRQCTVYIIPALIAGGAALAGTAINAISQGVTNRRNRQRQDELNEQAQENWQKEFDYQKYINENQYRIQAKDQALAGINPIAANGGSLQGFSAQAGQTYSDQQAPQIDTTGLQNALLQHAQLKWQSKENEKNRENAKEIAEINADASKYGADTSAGASKYSTDTQAAIAAENRKAQKQITDLDRASREKVAKWSNETQKALQEAQQEWQDSEDHAEAAKRLQKALEDAYDYGRELEAMKHLYITADGSKYRLDDYLKMLEIDLRAYENSPARRSEDAIYRGVDRVTNLLKAITGAESPRPSTNPRRR